MRKIIIFYLLFLSLSASASELPGQIFLKTPTQSYTHEYEVAIHEGKIWYRTRTKFAVDAEEWKLLEKTGLPVDKSFGFRKFKSPEYVKEISADGDNLIAVGNDGFVYYMKWSSLKWMNKWGQPFSQRLKIPENVRALAVSHRGPFAGGYEDIDGNFHPVSVGVTTLYVLSNDGLTISYADPWLPADFSRQICLPLKNRFRARSLGASASTLFVINDAGEMYTRLADYDTLGHNPVLAYTYERSTRKITKWKDVRTLPPEEWKRQPPISSRQGRISSAITIIQTGKGNSARELRVEGVNERGENGFFSKPINGDTWSFTKTNLPLQKPLLFVVDGIADSGPNYEKTLSGNLRAFKLSEEKLYGIELMEFNPPCSRAIISVMIGEDTARFPFFITASLRTDRKMKGAIIMPEEIKEQVAQNELLKEFVEDVFGDNSFVRVRLSIDNNDQAILLCR